VRHLAGKLLARKPDEIGTWYHGDVGQNEYKCVVVFKGICSIDQPIFSSILRIKGNEKSHSGQPELLGLLARGYCKPDWPC
jgi:hypothetical protein